MIRRLSGAIEDSREHVQGADAYKTSTPRTPDLMSGLGQASHHKFDMIALHFNHAILRGAAGTTGGTELLARRGQCAGVEHQASHHSHGLARAA